MVVIRAGAEIVGLALSAFVAIWLSRTVGPAGLGYYAVALTIVRFGGGITGAGLATVGSQRVAHEPQSARHVWTAVTSLRMTLAILAVLITELIAMAGPIGDPTIRLLVQLTAPAWLLLAISSDWLLVGNGNVVAVAVSRVLSATASALSALFLVQAPQDLPYIAVVIVAPTAAGCLATTLAAVGGVIGRPRIALPRRAMLTEFGGDAVQYLKADLSVLVYTSIDRLFLYFFATPAVVGLYEAAYKLIQPFYAIAVVVNDSMFRRMAVALESPDQLRRTIRRFADLMFFATVPLGFFLTLYAAPVVAVVYGPAFHESALYLAVLGWVITIGYLSGVVSIPLAAWRQPREYANAMLAGNVANVAGNLLLIPPFSGLGAALATIVAKTAVAGVGYRGFRHVTDYPIAADFILYCFFSSAAFVVTVICDQGLGLAGIASAVIFVLTYAGIVGMTRWRADLRRAWSGSL